jgi:hypothetical protein
MFFWEKDLTSEIDAWVNQPKQYSQFINDKWKIGLTEFEE